MSKAISEALKYIQKKHNDHIAFKANEPIALEHQAIPMSSPSLNDALGIGGIAATRIIQFAGKESSGKTLASFDAIKNAQQLDEDAWAIFIDAEFTYDEKWAKQLGVDLDRLLVIAENDGLEIWKILCGDPQKKEMPGLLNQALTDPKFAGLKIIVLDSIAAIEAPAEIGHMAGKQNMAPLARFLPGALRRITPYLNRLNAAMICINQVRVNPGVMYGDPTTSPGGNALRHACSMMLNFAKMKNEYNITDDNGDQVGHRIRVRVDKNKCATSYKTAEFDIKYLKGVVNTDLESFGLAIKYGVIVQRGSMFDYNGQSFKGKESLYSYLRENVGVEELQANINDRKTNFVDKPLDQLRLEDLQEKAEVLGLDIPASDLGSKEAVIAHITSISKD